MVLAARSILLQRIKDVGGYQIAADLLDCTREHLYQLVSGTNNKLPSIDFCARIDAELGVPMALWALSEAAA